MSLGTTVPQATLARWLEPEWAQARGETLGRLKPFTCWHLWFWRVSWPFSITLGFNKWIFFLYTIYALNPKANKFVLGPFSISFPITGHHVWILCFCLSYQFLYGPSMCRNYPVSPQVFFRKNCYICRYRFKVSMEGDELRVFLYHHLRSLSQQWLLDPT